jgi:hypothetical protein
MSDVAVGSLLAPAWTEREALMVRLMQENGDFRLRNEKLERLVMRPHEITQVVEGLNRIALAASSDAVRQEAEAAILRLLKCVGSAWGAPPCAD